MAKRILLGGLLGGIMLFVWGAISHMVLPLGEIGLKELSNEEPVLTALRENIRQPGFYFFPGLGMPHSEADEAARRVWEEKYRRGPWGVLIYHPQGGVSVSSALGTELLTNTAAAMVVACLLALALTGLSTFGLKVLFVALIGLVPGLDVDISYWAWYGFPGDYTLAVMADHLIGWALAGLVLAAIVKRPVA